MKIIRLLLLLASFIIRADLFPDYVQGTFAERVKKGDLVHYSITEHGFVKTTIGVKFAQGRAYNDTEAGDDGWVELFGNGT